jgi:hypothetical protein
VRRWKHEAVLDAMQARLDRKPHAMKIRRQTVEHVFGTLKHWMGSAHFLMKTLEHVGTEMSLHALAYNLKARHQRAWHRQDAEGGADGWSLSPGKGRPKVAGAQQRRSDLARCIGSTGRAPSDFARDSWLTKS